MKYLFFGIAGLLSFLLCFWGSMDFVFAAADVGLPEKKLPVVKIRTIEAAESFEILSYPARAEATINSMILAETEGVVEKILPLGSKVARGQRLMSINQTDPIFNFAPFKAVSPVKGLVSEVFVAEGTRVVRGQKLAMVTDPSQIRWSVEIPSNDLIHLKMGEKGELQLPGREKLIPVILRGLSPVVSAATGTSTALIEFISEKKSSTERLEVSPGQVAQVIFKTHPKKSLFVPESSLVYKGKQPFVRLLQGNKAVYSPVKIGVRNVESLEILEGLKVKDVLIERSTRFVPDGGVVQVETGADGQAPPAETKKN